MSVPVWEIMLRLFAALAVGGAVGAQREMKNSSAGLRTHMLVCLGSCLAMITNLILIGQYGNIGSMDAARMGSYVLGGIGFLGAGAIIKDGLRARGLTTAASIWVVAALGLAVGCGFYVVAVAACAFTVLTLWALKHIESKTFGRSGTISVDMEIRNEPGQLAAVLTPLVELGCSVKDVQMEHSDDDWIGLSLRLKLPPGVEAKHTKEKLGAVEGVRM
jgi:putative Mg2+ transporter-C (MgtC) family protein